MSGNEMGLLSSVFFFFLISIFIGEIFKKEILKVDRSKSILDVELGYFQDEIWGKKNLFKSPSCFKSLCLLSLYFMV